MSKAILLLPLFLLTTLGIMAQTASVDTGCVPLIVAFDAPSNASYFWDFKDGASSDLKSPDHTFSDPGIYEVELRDDAGGSLIGTIIITVYPDPIINIDANVRIGCPPLQVDFTSLINLDPAPSIQNIQWSFGDGSTSNDLNPSHIYTLPGVFPVSVQLTTNEMECDKTVIFDDYIVVESVGQVVFGINQTNICNTPASIFITNNSTQDSTFTYAWDFGNGITSSDFAPGTIPYDSDGTYSITLNVSSPYGCTDSLTRVITIGSPPIDLLFPDTVCIDVLVLITNNTPTLNFDWGLGTNSYVSDTLSREPDVRFRTAGFHTINLEVYNVPTCKSDTSFQVYVQAPEAQYTMTPEQGCHDPQIVNLAASATDFIQYIWNDSITSVPNFSFELSCPARDSIFINLLDSIGTSLIIETQIGCRDTIKKMFVHRKPYAHIFATVTQGCAPLEVGFFDVSESLSGILHQYWDLGDGTIINDMDSLRHLYTEPGEYYVQLIVETNEGCIDTAAGRWIEVGEMIPPSYTISDLEICLNESVEIIIDNDDPRIDSRHVNTDDGRFSHCFLDLGATHKFETRPGSYPIELTIEYNGCYSDTTVAEEIVVNGANADISYMINCDSPFDLMLLNEGINADYVRWLIDGTEISTLDSLSYSFSDKGDYLLTLITADTNSGCPADTSEAEIFIRVPEASFTMDSLMCRNLLYDLDGAASIDVDNDCSQGYLWKLPFSRPIEQDSAMLKHVFPQAGTHEVSLIVEDLHGCRDTLTKTTQVFGIDAQIELSDYRICYPDSVTFINATISDTTIVNQQWNFGSTDSIVSVYYPDTSLTFYIYHLTVTDALGCTDDTGDTLKVYKPTTTIIMSPSSTVCVGEEITFSAPDFTEEGSSLSFLWDFGIYGLDNNQSVSLSFDQEGSYPVTLYYEEIGSGCNDSAMVNILVLPRPQADFISTVDTVSTLCYPAQIEFYNTTIFNGATTDSWYLNGEGPYMDVSPTFAFDKGTHEVMLIVRSFQGCADTIRRNFTLVGPEGGFTAFPTSICLGEEVTFTLMDTIDVARWDWDFGDGIVVENGNPVTHIYDFLPPTGTTNASLVLYSDDAVCEYIETIPINIGGPMANFEHTDSLAYCEGLASFRNLSTNADQYTWTSNGTVFSNSFEPTHDFNTAGNVEVTLEATDIASGCKSEITMELDIEPVDEFVKIPNVFTPNGDMLNQYFNLVITEPNFEQFVKISTFRVYNRWGELLYNNETPDTGWDGFYKNAEAPNEVYAYYIEYEIIDCEQKLFKGNVTIIR